MNALLEYIIYSQEACSHQQLLIHHWAVACNHLVHYPPLQLWWAPNGVHYINHMIQSHDDPNQLILSVQSGWSGMCIHLAIHSWLSEWRIVSLIMAPVRVRQFSRGCIMPFYYYNFWINFWYTIFSLCVLLEYLQITWQLYKFFKGHWIELTVFWSKPGQSAHPCQTCFYTAWQPYMPSWHPVRARIAVIIKSNHISKVTSG